MKNILMIMVLTMGLVNAQGITNTLGGDTANDKFIVENKNSEAGLAVTGEGNVGIGTSTPEVRFHLFNGTGNFTGEQYQQIDGIIEDDGSAYLEFNGIGKSGIIFPTSVADGQAGYIYDSNTRTLRLYNNDILRMSILEGGNVGIGTINPNYKLDVTGPANLNNGASGTFLRANSVEAAWYNGDYFSWGYGGNYNYFADPIQVGYTGIAPTYQFEATVNDAFGYIAEFRNSNTGVNADGVRIRLGPNANPGSSNGFLRCWDGDDSYLGGINGDGSGGVNYTTVSDARLKMNIIDYPSALDKVSKIRVRQYEMKSAPGNEQIGFLAQELQKIYPQAVGGDSEGDVNSEPMGIDYGRLTPLLVKAIQELQARVEELENR